MFKFMTINQETLIEKLRDVEPIPLIRKNFEEFIEKARGIFEPKGTKIMQYTRVGYNQDSAQIYDWSEGQPGWTQFDGDDICVFDFIQRREKLLEQGIVGITVFFESDIGPTFGINPQIGTLKFAFDPNRAIYTRDETHLGNYEFPWETLYVRLS